MKFKVFFFYSLFTSSPRSPHSRQFVQQSLWTEERFWPEVCVCVSTLGNLVQIRVEKLNPSQSPRHLQGYGSPISSRMRAGPGGEIGAWVPHLPKKESGLKENTRRQAATLKMDSVRIFKSLWAYAQSTGQNTMSGQFTRIHKEASAPVSHPHLSSLWGYGGENEWLQLPRLLIAGSQ